MHSHHIEGLTELLELGFAQAQINDGLTPNAVARQATFSFNTGTKLPEDLKCHLELNGAQLRVFSKDDQYKPSTQLLLDRLSSIEKAFLTLIEKPPTTNSHSLQDLKRKKIGYLAYIKKHFDLDVKALEVKGLKKVLENFETFVQNIIFVDMAKAFYDTKKLTEEQYHTFLTNLRKAEIEAISKTQRKSFVNIEAETGYFTAEIPLGMHTDGTKKVPYTHQSYKRDSGELANYVLHIMGRRDPKTGEVTIFNQCTRAANYMAIDNINDPLLAFQQTVSQVKQRHESVLGLHAGNPPKAFTQISLLSPVHRAAKAIDEQHGYEQTRYTYLAFLLQNHRKSTLPMRYMVEGVNVMRKNSLSDPIKFYINTRYYNQLISDTCSKLKSINPVIGNDSSLLFEAFAIEMQTKFKPLEIQRDQSWMNVEAIIQKLHDNYNSLDEHKLNKLLKDFDKALKAHHYFEKKLFDAKQAYFKDLSQILNKELKNLQKSVFKNPNVAPELIQQYNLLRELDNLYFLMEKNRSQSLKYNYQLQACIHRQETNLSHEVGVNCNDSEDRTGVENCVVMASYEVIAEFGHGLAPSMRSDRTLAKIKKYTKNHQAKDAGINNTGENGVAGQQVSASDVDGFIDPYAVEMAKLTKSVYAPILKEEEPLNKIKALGFNGVITAVGRFVSSKVVQWLEPLKTFFSPPKLPLISQNPNSNTQRVVDEEEIPSSASMKKVSRGLIAFSSAALMFLTLSAASATKLEPVSQSVNNGTFNLLLADKLSATKEERDGLNPTDGFPSSPVKRNDDDSDSINALIDRKNRLVPGSSMGCNDTPLPEEEIISPRRSELRYPG